MVSPSINAWLNKLAARIKLHHGTLAGRAFALSYWYANGTVHVPAEGPSTTSGPSQLESFSAESCMQVLADAAQRTVLMRLVLAAGLALGIWCEGASSLAGAPGGVTHRHSAFASMASLPLAWLLAGNLLLLAVAAMWVKRHPRHLQVGGTDPCVLMFALDAVPSN